MPYIPPETVVSPKSRWRLLEVLFNTGNGGWSLARGQWEDEGRWGETIGMRWNGSDEAGGSSGSPQSHGNPTWFIVPEELHEVIEKFIRDQQGSVYDNRGVISI